MTVTQALCGSLRAICAHRSAPRFVLARSWSYLTAVSYKSKPPFEDDKPPLHVLSPDSAIALWKNRHFLDQGLGSGLNGDLGEDAAFVQPDASNNNLCIGVFDGVGGWSRLRVDASIFSTALAYYASHHAKRDADPLHILKSAFQGVQRERDVVAGSCTACIVSLDRVSGTLTAANLGDSSFLILRDGKVIHHQPSQQYYFNCPRQLSKIPRKWQEPGSIEDPPDAADRAHVQLEHGDLVVLTTDGVIDNLYDNDIEKIYDICSASDLSLQTFAHSLVRAAYDLSMDEKRLSPWSLGARQSGNSYRDITGGKVDDMTVVCVQVAQ